MLISAIGRDKQHHNSRGDNYKYYSPKYSFIVGSLHLKTLTYNRWNERVITSPGNQKVTRFPIAKIRKSILSLRFSHLYVISHSAGGFLCFIWLLPSVAELGVVPFSILKGNVSNYYQFSQKVYCLM